MRFFSIFILSFFFFQTAFSHEKWEEKVAGAKNTVVNFYAWGGSPLYNDYISWVGKRVKEKFSITLNHVKITDTSSLISILLADKKANKEGSIDIMWINGENFKNLKNHDLLVAPFTHILPHIRYTDSKEIPGIYYDFSIPTDGREAPWGRAQFIFFADKKTVPQAPKNALALLEYAKKNKGRITYPAPPDFTGVTFMKQLLIELSNHDEALEKPIIDQAHAHKVAAPLWQYLDEITPYLWQEGKNYPKNESDLLNYVSQNIIDIGFSFNVGALSNAISQDLMPETSYVFTFDKGTIGNVHFLSIPFNSQQKSAAYITINYMMSPEAQARKMNPEYWGEPTILSYNKLNAKDKAFFDAIPIKAGMPTREALGSSLQEPHPDWVRYLEDTWAEKYGH